MDLLVTRALRFNEACTSEKILFIILSTIDLDVS